jgi:hypothetical protein
MGGYRTQGPEDVAHAGQGLTTLLLDSGERRAGVGAGAHQTSRCLCQIEHGADLLENQRVLAFCHRDALLPNGEIFEPARLIEERSLRELQLVS